MVPSVSRRRRYACPLGNAARATRAVASGTGPMGSGCSDIGTWASLSAGLFAGGSPIMSPPSPRRRIRQQYQLLDAPVSRWVASPPLAEALPPLGAGPAARAHGRREVAGADHDETGPG